MSSLVRTLLSEFETKDARHYGVVENHSFGSVGLGWYDTREVELYTVWRDVGADRSIPSPPRNFESVRFLAEDIDSIIVMLTGARDELARRAEAQKKSEAPTVR